MTLELNRNVDFRYAAGFPTVEKALADGTRLVRCISHPDMEVGAAEYLAAGIRVIGVYTGESDAAGRYVMKNISALQVGNEPSYAYPNGAASWPTGTADDMVNVWSYIANVLVPATHPGGLPLIGPSFWAQDYSKWAQVAAQLPGLSAAAVHCYPGPSGQNPTSLRTQLGYYRKVRSDVPLICAEYHTDDQHLSYARAIDAYCDARLWQGYNGANNLGDLEGTAAYGILALSGS